MEKQKEMFWRNQVVKVLGQLRATFASYKTQVCQEIRGGLSLSNTRDFRGEYVAARATAQALEESARLEGVPPGWVRIPWEDFPEPQETNTSTYDPSTIAKKWGCGALPGR